jgi:hypothetical protein
MTYDEWKASKPTMTPYKVGIKYINPSPGGPFRGREIMSFPSKPERGQVIYAMFGRAVITSVSKPISEPYESH